MREEYSHAANLGSNVVTNGAGSRKSGCSSEYENEQISDGKQLAFAEKIAISVLIEDEPGQEPTSSTSE